MGLFTRSDMKYILTRYITSDEGTFGVLRTPDGASWFSLELPWKDNKRQVSCIPEGTYTAKIRNSPRFGKVYHLQNVKDRSYILIHSGNYAGDESKGYKSHVEGCILLGKRVGTLDGQRAVMLSKPAIREFMDSLNGSPFELEIKYD